MYVGVRPSWIRMETGAGTCEWGNESSDSVKWGKILDAQKSRLLLNDSAAFVKK